MSTGAAAAALLVAAGLISCILGVGLLSMPTVAGGLVVVGVGLVVGVVSGRRYERGRRR